MEGCQDMRGIYPLCYERFRASPQMGICWFRGKEIAVVNSKVSIFEQPMFDQKGSVVGIFPVSRAIVSFVRSWYDAHFAGSGYFPKPIEKIK